MFFMSLNQLRPEIDEKCQKTSKMCRRLQLRMSKMSNFLLLCRHFLRKGDGTLHVRRGGLA